MSLAQILTTFSSYKDMNQDVTDIICENYGIATIERILDKSRGTLFGIDEFKSEALAAFDQVGSKCWTPEIGRANELMTFGENFIGAARAQLAAALIVCGWDGEVTIDIGQKVKIFVGPLQIICIGVTKFVAEGESVTITSSGVVSKLSRRNDAIRFVDSVPVLIANSNVSSISMVGGYCIDSDCVFPEDETISAHGFPAGCAALDAALAFLGSVGHLPSEWVLRAVRRLSVIGIPEGTRQTSSRSFELRPGNVVISAPSDEIVLAESLVHESSHQYFYMGLRLGSYIKPEYASKQFYSAINGKYRSIDRLILALHAVVNMYNLFDDIISQGSTWCDRAMARLRHFGPTGCSLAGTIEANRAALSPNSLEMVEKILETTHAIARKYDLPSAVPAEAGAG